VAYPRNGWVPFRLWRTLDDVGCVEGWSLAAISRPDRLCLWPLAFYRLLPRAALSDERGELRDGQDYLQPEAGT
jgi:hypothetical protein